MKKITLILFILFFLLIQNKGLSQDTIYWSPCYRLKYEDFKGKPDITKIDLANSYIRISYTYDTLNCKLQFKIKCYFLKNISWAKYNMDALMDHEQCHFDIAKLFAIKLEQRFSNYKITKTIQQDLAAIYDATIKEEYAKSDLFDKIEKENPNTDVPQKKFQMNIRSQLPVCNEKR